MTPRRPGTGDARALGRSLRVLTTKALPECPDDVFTGHIAGIYSPVCMNALLQWCVGALR
jgi:hypothetical protein